MIGNNVTYQTDDAIYSYQIFGEGDPLVLLHGFTGSKSTWLPFVGDWGSEYKLIIVDLPGHGETMTKTPRSMEQICHDLKQLFNHLKLTTVHLAGYSMGGRIALSFAIHYPNWVKSLTLESASPGLTLKKERIERIEQDEQLAQKIENEGIPSFVSFWESIPLFQTQKKLSNHIQRSIRNERLSQSEKGLAESLRSIGTGAQPSWWDYLHELSVQTLLIVGKEDAKFVNINKEMKNRMTLANIAIVDDVGHTVHVENQVVFSKLVLDFLRKTDEEMGH